MAAAVKTNGGFHGAAVSPRDTVELWRFSRYRRFRLLQLLTISNRFFGVTKMTTGLRI